MAASIFPSAWKPVFRSHGLSDRKFRHLQELIRCVSFPMLRCAVGSHTPFGTTSISLDARLAHAEYTGAENGTIPLDEVTVGGGLGWHFRP
ncbi:MAG: hypothetical protein IPL81_11520 [Flavobacteriales bacterium]|nr:hypothetical protein [Flavobacteriales bacterium]